MDGHHSRKVIGKAVASQLDQSHLSIFPLAHSYGGWGTIWRKKWLGDINYRFQGSGFAIFGSKFVLRGESLKLGRETCLWLLFIPKLYWNAPSPLIQSWLMHFKLSYAVPEIIFICDSPLLYVCHGRFRLRLRILLIALVSFQYSQQAEWNKLIGL